MTNMTTAMENEDEIHEDEEETKHRNPNKNNITSLVIEQKSKVHAQYSVEQGKMVKYD